MCGIAGISAAPGMGADDALRILGRMRDAQHHRGPDDTGLLWNERASAGLAACRLSIRDLSPAGHMPMCVDDVCITYNGEIYNAEALREELAARGHAFRSHSDTEVILRGYLEWGDEVVTRLRGMFAFGILDTRTNTFVLARDPLGIKPLYYTTTAPFSFGSELSALARSGAAATSLNDTALSAYLQLGSIPAPLTIYRDISALRPAHIAHVPLANPAKMTSACYWSLAPGDGSTDVGQVGTALEEAVRSHLVSDVPIGAFLSGGLDSSAVVALASQHCADRLITCSIGFESAGHDESRFARAVARAFGTEHHERVVSRDEFLRTLPGFFQHIDQPTIDGYNTYFVAETARQAGLKVALSGLGGDELFGGYPTFAGVPRLLRALRLARAGGSFATQTLSRVTHSDRWRKVAAAVQRPVSAASAFLVYRGLFTRAEAEQLLPDARHFDAEAYVADRAGDPHGSVKAWVGRAELATYTTSQLLRDSDVASMAHSLELRVPLLDTKLIEAVHRLPPEMRFPRGGNKPLLRALMADRLPRGVVERRDRQGFSFPMPEWLQGHTRQELDAEAMAAFDRIAVDEVRARFRAGHAHWSRMWSLIALNEWSRVAHA